MERKYITSFDWLLSNPSPLLLRDQSRLIIYSCWYAFFTLAYGRDCPSNFIKNFKINDEELVRINKLRVLIIFEFLNQKKRV